MDRKPPSSDDFETLRRLLALKRHERPPPGFFEDFSARVMARIATEEEMRARCWWARLAELVRPASLFVPANALTAFGLVFVGASLYLVVNSRPGSTGAPGRDDDLAVQPGAGRRSTTPAVAGILATPPPTPPPSLETYTVLRLEPVAVDPDTNAIPRDLFSVPRLRTLQGSSVETPTLLLQPR